MDYKVIEAYAKGRLAGAKYSQEKQRDPALPRPSNPHKSSAYLASVEWDRGFAEGYELSQRRIAASEVTH
jgi:hypothetical protein